MLFRLLIVILLPIFGFSQTSLLERSYTFESEKESVVEAKKEIQDKAVSQIVDELGIEIMGDARYAKRKSKVNPAMVQKSARFIPFSNITESKQIDKKLKQTVLFKVNVTEFRNILRSLGQLEEIDKNQSILSLIRFENAISQREYSWWQKGDEALAKTATKMEQNLSELFMRGGFYLAPAGQVSLSALLPLSFNKTSLETDEVLRLARLMQTPYVLSGNILIKRSERLVNQMRIELHLKLIQAENGKALADIKRVYEQALPKDSSKLDDEINKKISEESEALGTEMVSLMTDALQRGIINSQKIRLKFSMVSQPQKIEQLKDRVKLQSASIKSVKEKSIAANSVTFEIDFVGSIKEIQDKLLAMDVNSLSYAKLELTGSQPEEIAFELK